MVHWGIFLGRPENTFKIILKMFKINNYHLYEGSFALLSGLLWVTLLNWVTNIVCLNTYILVTYLVIVRPILKEAFIRFSVLTLKKNCD